MSEPVGVVTVEKPVLVGGPTWCEVRCFQCGKMLLKITAYPVDEGIQDAVKIGLDLWCRRCKINVYKNFVV